MKKIKALKMILLVFCLAVFVSGCGTDKYIGNWVGIERPNDPTSPIMQISIEKNGNNYLVKMTEGRYHGTKLSLLENGDREFTWQTQEVRNKSAVLKNDKLYIDGAVDTFTFIEKDNTLLYSGLGGISFKKDTGKEFEEMKKTISESTLQQLKKDYPKGNVKLID